MNFKPILLSIALVAVPATMGHALTLNNEDDVDYVLEVIAGVGDANVEMLELAAGGSLDDICNSGCTISLGNGNAYSFVGDEQVSIVDGEFVLSE